MEVSNEDRQKMLTELVEKYAPEYNPQQKHEFTVDEWAEKLGVKTSAAQKQLLVLVKSGEFTRRRIATPDEMGGWRYVYREAEDDSV